MLASLKRALRPVRPLLLPVWRPVRGLLRPKRRKDPWGPPRPGAAASRPKAGQGAVGATASPIRALRAREFDELARRFPYYKRRRHYTAVACRIADELIDRGGLRTALELGPFVRPIVVGADVMDRTRHAQLQAEGQVIIHDATDVPWPFEDRHYDLCVALQVFEHLDDRQNAAFMEVRRVARNAIISLPIDWQMDDTSNPHHALTNERALSWFLPVVPTRVDLGNGGKRKRLIYVFEDLPPLATA